MTVGMNTRRARKLAEMSPLERQVRSWQLTIKEEELELLDTLNRIEQLLDRIKDPKKLRLAKEYLEMHEPQLQFTVDRCCRLKAHKAKMDTERKKRAEQ